MYNESANNIWLKKWPPSVHETEHAGKRIKSASSAKLTPTNLDYEQFSGHFVGSHGNYDTRLDFCPCGDFIRSKLPCKHIYRLAIEFGLLDIQASSDVNAILTPRKDRISLSDTVNIIEKLSTDAQLLLLDIAKNIRSTSPTYLVKASDELSELIQCNIVINAYPNEFNVCYGKKNEIIELLEANNVVFNKKDTKAKLQQLCDEQIKEVSVERFGIKIYVSIPTKYSSVKIHKYLHRKFDYEPQLIDDGTFRVVPVLHTVLPDDDVTIQLKNYGYYPVSDESLK